MRITNDRACNDNRARFGIRAELKQQQQQQYTLICVSDKGSVGIYIYEYKCIYI